MSKPPIHNMVFYTLDTATDTPETGPVFPQIKAMRPGYDFNKPNSIHNLTFKGLPDFQPDLDYFILTIGIHFKVMCM